MARASGLRHCCAVSVFFLVAWLCPPQLVWGQQAPPAGAPAAESGAPSAPTGQAEPPPGGPAGQTPTQPGAPPGQIAPQPGTPAGQAVVPEPVFPGFPSPTLPVG